MYPTMKSMDAVPSGSGVFYQAMPAVGADGKNIMKLIPVQLVNGQFVQTQINQPKTVPTPQKAVTINFPPRPVQLVKNTSSAVQQVSIGAALPNQTGFQIGNPPNKRPLQQQTANLPTRVPSTATHVANHEKAVTVTVKSPSLPSGQYLQISPNAKVQTVSASQLPPVIKKQFFDSLAKSCPGSNNVVSAPVTTMTQGTSPQGENASMWLKVLSNLSKTSKEPPVKASKPQLKLIPKVSERPGSPIRWVIEEDSSTPQARVPLISPSVTSEILHATAQREIASKRNDVVTKPGSQLDQGKSEQAEENTLVMCNGKVFLLAKKHGPPPKMGDSNSPTAAKKILQLDKTRAPSSQRSLQSGTSGTRRIVRITIPDEDEVIDLCDDDDSSQPASSADVQPDEDNVVFVSYVPPQTDSGSAKDCQQSTSTRQLDIVEVVIETESHTQNMESPENPHSCHMSDHMLRQMFGITADVKICLQRIDEVLDGFVLDTSSPHTHIRPVKCSHFTVNTKFQCRSGQSSLSRTSHDVETDPASGYVEPLDDEDFFGAHENDPKSLDADWRPQSKIPVVLNTDTRRVGRARKRTICPCCVPSAPAAKSSAKPAEPEKQAWTTEQTGKRGGREKAARKDVKTTAKNTQDCETSQAPASDDMSTTSMDSDEAQPLEDIERVMKLLRDRKKCPLKNGGLDPHPTGIP